MFSIGLSGRHWISHWPEMENEFREISPNPITIVRKHTGELVIKDAKMGRVDDGPKNPDHEPMSMQLRPVFHQMLYRQIKKLEIEVTCGKRAIEFFEDDEKAYVLTDDQQRASADVIIASDGIGSKAQQIVNGGRVEAKSSGTGMFRASVSSNVAFADPLVMETFGLNEGQNSVAQVWLGLVMSSRRDGFKLTSEIGQILTGWFLLQKMFLLGLYTIR
jgi:2-polyprenyl-6-methoxyphenol hydroxylase-like FAD-dependent oxidoreductase